MAPTRKSSSSCKNRSASSTTTTIEVRKAIAVILHIAFTLLFFYIIGIWLGTTLSTSTKTIHETSLRSSSSSNNNQAATIIDHPVGINSEGRSNFFLSWFFGSKNKNVHSDHDSVRDIESCLRPRSNSNAMTKSPLRPPCTFKECIYTYENCGV